MPLPTFTPLVDGVDDILASHHNVAYTVIEAMARGIPLADYTNTETLAATLTLTDADPPLQFLDPGGAGRQINLPAEAAANHPFYIVNEADAAETLTVKDDAGNTIDTVAQGEAKVFFSNGVAWRALSGGAVDGPQGFLINGKLAVTVATNDLTVAVKTLAGTDPSAGDPVYVRIGNTVRAITAALSVTALDGTNWCAAGSAELATNEVDYFVYLGYNATDGVVIGFSRIPYATRYDGFHATSTNEKFCKISNIANAAAGDYYELVGRFAATLSASPFTWTVPTFTAINLINRPIYKTRLLTFVPTHTRATTPYTTLPTTDSATYILDGELLIFVERHTQAATPGGTGAQQFTVPFVLRYSFVPSGQAANETTGVTMLCFVVNTAARILRLLKYDATAEVTASQAYHISGSSLVA